MTQDYDAVFGADQVTINNLIAATFDALKPSGLFKITVPVNKVDIATAIIEINKPFVVNLSAPPHLIPQLKSAIGAHSVPETAAKLLLAAAAPVALTITAPSIDVTLSYATDASPTTLNDCSLSLGALVATHGSDSTLSVQISSGLVNTKNPVMDEILNKAIIPFAIDTLNKDVFGPIRVPPLTAQKVTVSLPVPRIQQPFLLGFTALGTNQPDVLPVFNAWPRGKVFIAIDAPLILAAANAVLPLTQGDTFKWSSFTGSYGVSVGPVSAIHIKPDASIEATVEARADFNITFHTPDPFPNFSWSPSAKAIVTADALVKVSGGELDITYESFEPPSFDFDWGSLDWVDWLLNPLLDGLADALGDIVVPIINGILHGHTFNVLTIPAIPVKGYKIKLDDVQTTFAQVNKQALLIAAGVPSIAPI